MRRIRERSGIRCGEKDEAASLPRIALPVILISVLLAGVLPAGCIWRRNKPESPRALAAPVRILILPLNVKESEDGLRDLSLLSSVMLAQIVETAPDLEAVGFRDGLPSALRLLGGSRHIEADAAALIGDRLSSHWVVQGSLAGKDGEVALLLDFVPTKADVFAFRYEKKIRPGSLGESLRDAVSRFLRYRTFRPLAADSGVPSDPESLQRIAATLDREYGWFVPAAPGEARDAVAELRLADPELVRVLFEPWLQTGSVSATPDQPVPPSAEAAGPHKAALPAAAEAPALPLHDQQQGREKGTQTQPGRVAGNPAPRRVALPAPLSFTQKIIPAPAKPVTAADPGSEPVPRSVSGAGPSQGLITPQKSSHPERRYLIQIYATRDRTEADARADRLREAGFSPVIRRADLGDKGLWFRVRIAGFESRETAEAAGRKLQAKGIAEDYWVIP